MKKFAFILVLFIFCGAAFATSSYAATLKTFSDTITTSRPSAASTLNADVTGGVNTFSAVINDNKSIFIASDAATFLADGSETPNIGLNVASMSALNTNTRTIYFTQNIGNNHHAGDAVIVPITAMHTIQFTTQTFVPSGGKIVITFPGGGSTIASPSATTFSFNGLTSANAALNITTNNANTCTWTVTAPTITCVTSSTINPNTTVTFLIGCADNVTNHSTCTTQSPRFINPTRNPADSTGGAAATTNTADNWKINVQTQDGSSNVLDNSTTTIGTIESVQVQASVDPTLTFSITGLANGVALNSGHGASCPADTTNSGFTALGASVNLGTLVPSTVNMSAQDLTVSTNEAGGYALTATASGALFDPSNGYGLLSTTTPTVLSSLPTELFGIHPCGTDVSSGTWAPTSSGITAGAGKIAWPATTSSSTTLSIASRTSQASSVVTTVEYIGTVTNTTPAGTYNSTITYVATPTFN